MKSRFYDPLAGRFLQPDSIVPDYANPQSLNRYSYVLNNPLRYTDPTGYCFDSADFWSGCDDVATDFVTSTLPNAGRSSAGWAWNRTRWGARQSQDAFLWSWGGATGTAQDVWASGPVEAAREYVADKSQDMAVVAVESSRHPGTLPQNTLALGFSFMTVGDRRGSHSGLVAYENAKGPVAWFMLGGVLHNSAFTPGDITFAKGTYDAELYWHEYRHFQQSKFMRPTYVPVYIAVNLVVLGRENLHPMEIDANRYANRRLEKPLPWD